MCARVYLQYESCVCVCLSTNKLFLISRQKVLFFYHLLSEFLWFFSLSFTCKLVLLVVSHISNISLLGFVVLWPGWVGAFFFFLR